MERRGFLGAALGMVATFGLPGTRARQNEQVA